MLATCLDMDRRQNNLGRDFCMNEFKTLLTQISLNIIKQFPQASNSFKTILIGHNQTNTTVPRYETLTTTSQTLLSYTDGRFQMNRLPSSNHSSVHRLFLLSPCSRYRGGGQVSFLLTRQLVSSLGCQDDEDLPYCWETILLRILIRNRNDC